MAEIVECEWTSIGSEGFEYYWDPTDTAYGGLFIYWQKGDKVARCQVDPETAANPRELAYLLQRRTWDVEMSYRKHLDDEHPCKNGCIC